MKKEFCCLMLALFCVVCARAEAFDLEECRTLAARFHANPFALSVGELDSLRLCGFQMMNMKQQQEREEKESKAIEKNF